MKPKIMHTTHGTMNMKRIRHLARWGTFLLAIGHLCLQWRIRSRSNLSEDCEEKCSRLFLSGVDVHYGLDPTTSSLLESDDFESCRCDKLLCDSIQISDEGGATCQWSYFAIDSLLNHNDEQPCSTQSQLDEFFTPPGWEHYQFSDGFKNLHKKQTEQWRYLYIRRAPKSALLRDYFEQTRGNWENYKELNKLVNRRAQRSNELLPPENAIVIHLRLGDVIDKARESVRELLYEQRYFYSQEDVNLPCPTIQRNGNFTPLVMDWNAYVKPLSYFSERLDIVSQYSSVILMGSAHKGGGIHKGKEKCKEEDMTANKSCQYINGLKSFFERSLHKDITISLRLGQTPDDDIVFGSQAACFISSGGGFSDIIKRLQVMNTGACETSLSSTGLIVPG